MGERGVNLSGGQKARIGFARAVYAALLSDEPLVLLDDVFAAVDPAVAAKLAASVRSLAFLKSAAVIVATHQAHLAPHTADFLLTLDKRGRPVSYVNVTPTDEAVLLDEALTQEDVRLIEVHRMSFDDDDDPEDNFSDACSLVGCVDAADLVDDSETTTKEEEDVTDWTLCVQEVNDLEEEPEKPPMKKAQLVVAEDRAMGRVRWTTWAKFFAAAGIVRVTLTAVVFVAAQVAGMAADAYVLEWAGAERQRRPRHAIILSSLAGATLIFALGASVSFFGATSKASTRLHDGALHGVLQAPLSYFGANPLGRIINRFSTDVSNSDEQLALALFDFTQIALLMTSAVVLAVAAVPYVILAFPFLAYAFYSVKVFVTKSMSELKRLDSINKSPVLERYAGTLHGLRVTRAFTGASQAADAEMRRDLETSASCWFWWMVSNRFLGTRLDAFCTALLGVLCGLAIALRDQTQPELLALALIYGVQLSGNFQYAVRQKALTDTFMTSVERLLHYRDKLPVEEEEEPVTESSCCCWGGASTRPKTTEGWSNRWPREGGVVFEAVSCRYREDLPVILVDVTLKFPALRKSAVVGRTGGGKSSTLLCLLRLNEITKGRVLIDGVDLATVPLSVLRTAIAFIPQEPTIFRGTVASNLRGKSNDDSATALRAAGLISGNDDVDDVLRRPVDEGGANFSTGEKQLLCLARALLLQRRIVAIDEGTANVDHATDQHIQTTLTTAFSKATVIVVAHRLRTIIDAANVVVLDQGHVVEAGDPRDLSRKSDGVFKTMLSASNLVGVYDHIDDE